MTHCGRDGLALTAAKAFAKVESALSDRTMPEDVFADDYETGPTNVGRSAVRNLSAINARVDQSAVQRLTAEVVHADRSAFGVTNASTLELNQSAIGVAAGDYVKIEESRVMILLAPRVSGNVKAFVTLPAALAFGAGYFAARSLAHAIFKRRDR
jgi:hypothetical protein